jgi:histidinol-phosphate aminotransferase
LGPEHLLAGSGADELIDLLLRLVLEPGDRVLDCPPSFGMYPFVTRICGGKVVEVARDDQFNIDVDGCLAKFDDRVKAIFIASPNNPTGNVCSTNTVEKLLTTGALVVVDETYYEFCGKTLAHEVPKHSNLVVLRSLSKWAGLAGLRVGYAVLPVDLSQLLFAMKPPYNLNSAAEVALLASLEDKEFLIERVQAILHERVRLQELLERAPRVTKVWPSEGNFLLCQFAENTAQKVFVELAQKGISVRYFDTPRLQDCLRISVGLPEQSDSLIQALSEI